MGYCITLINSETNEPVEVKTHRYGSAYAIAGCELANLLLTYNYAPHYYKSIDKDKGLRWLYGRKGRDCIDVLERAIEELGTERDENYWKNTPGNAGYALSILLQWAKQHPDAVFVGD